MSGYHRRPSYPAMELGRQLKAERERPRLGHARGYRKSELPKKIISERNLLEIESGRKKTVKRGVVRDLCHFYGSGPDLTEHLVLLADATFADEWTDAYSSVVDKDGWLYQVREDQASRLLFHDSTSMPSLLHTPAYLRMMADTTRVNFEATEIDWEQAIRFRQDRQRRWIASQRPAVFLIGEAAFALEIGDGVAAELRDRVLELAELPFADIRVIPFAAGRYELLGWEVNLLEFDNGDEPFLQVRSPRGAGFLPIDSRIGRFFQQAFPLTHDISVPVKEHFS